MGVGKSSPKWRLQELQLFHRGLPAHIEAFAGYREGTSAVGVEHEAESALFVLPCEMLSFEKDRYLKRALQKYRVFQLSLIASIPLTLFCRQSAKADDTLVLELPPSQAAIENRSTRKAQSEARRLPEIPAENRNFPDRNERVVLASRGKRASRQDANESGIGRLGQTTQEASIFRGKNERSAKLSRVSTGTYLAIKADEGEWIGILMSDNSIGWMQRSAVKILDYQVTATSQGSARPFDPTYSDGLPSAR